MLAKFTLDNCSAYVIASESEWRNGIEHLLTECGFGEIQHMSADADLHEAAVDGARFVFIHAGVGVEVVDKVATAIRNQPLDKAKYMPVLLLIDAASLPDIQKFMVLACDDVVMYPGTLDALKARIMAQIGHPRDYFETDSYFGPDRRKPGTRSGNDEGVYYRHIIIKRKPNGDIDILEKKTHTPRAKFAAG